MYIEMCEHTQTVTLNSNTLPRLGFTRTRGLSPILLWTR